ncbi:MAG: ADYC domain-containing protein [Polyangiaceae bacterium]
MSAVLASKKSGWGNSLAGVALIAAFTVGCQGASGSPVGAGTELAARDENGQPVTLRVDSVEKDQTDPDGDIFLYDVSYKDPSNGEWKKFCFPDKEGRTVAIPLAGYWDSTKSYVAEEGVFTFACMKSPLAKCVRWGYKPWKTVNGVSLRDYHLACVRMTRADYCGDGKHHTREGTAIEIYDNLDHLKRQERPDLLFEAAWSPNGAVYLNKPRYGEGPSSLVEECPDRLRDRTSITDPGLDKAAIMKRWPEAILFNDSKLIREPF